METDWTELLSVCELRRREATTDGNKNKVVPGLFHGLGRHFAGSPARQQCTSPDACAGSDSEDIDFVGADGDHRDERSDTEEDDKDQDVGSSSSAADARSHVDVAPVAAEAEVAHTAPAAMPAAAGALLPQRGLKEVDVAISSRAVCFVCEANIEKGSWRVGYRLKASHCLKDQRYCHFRCATRLPAATREADVRKLRDLLVQPGISVDRYEAIDGLVAELVGDTGAAASAG